ncbi:hypothetical protein BGX38DRAFT_1235706 [Terfezia claveryi]|nr:hypothetical protein BGX38DRAFT_1235706 [Terfezia claveryi]
MRAPLPYLLLTSRVLICLPANHTYLLAASTKTYFQACVNEHNMRARTPPLCTGNSTSQSAAGEAEVRTPPVYS